MKRMIESMNVKPGNAGVWSMGESQFLKSERFGMGPESPRA